MFDRYFKLTLLISLVLIFSSCLILSKQSLIDPQRAKGDRRLQGRWRGTNNLKDVYAVFDGDSSLETNILAGPEPANKSDLLFDVLTGSIGKYQYMSIKPRGEEGFLLARYTIEKNELKIWLLDSPLIDAAISEGRLKKSSDGSSSTMLSDTPKKIVTFIVKNEDRGGLFEHLGTFYKDDNK